MGDEEASGQQPADDEKKTGTAGSIYGGATGPARTGADNDPDSTSSTDSGEPTGDQPDDGDGPPDDGSIYGG